MIKFSVVTHVGHKCIYRGSAMPYSKGAQHQCTITFAISQIMLATCDI